MIDPPKMPLELASLDGDERATGSKLLKEEKRKKDLEKEDKHNSKQEEKSRPAEPKPQPSATPLGGR